MAGYQSSTVIPDTAAALIDAPEFATLATIEPDGQPQLSVVWLERDGDEVLISTVRGRRKTDNLLRDPRATVLIYPASGPYSYVEIRGTTSITDDPGGTLIHKLANKYTGAERWEHDTPDTPRVIVRLKPSKVIWKG
ncbi:PPOX class F420-dependent oxidoreductase [Prescottella agglutinans]|uniref:PPOX class probable F420-dependent enzyme n=1 Tax=Prescottella agglutinans TaxID=1644129 RepID=A0ABT6MAK8_9NOCA|nr:PPOX class F420-dependent oxidoreductase [Prescottella agglutinans]MDH6281332.1 PPOX class probable F420-dependent enzyme [Prescottella agglutinans]